MMMMSKDVSAMAAPGSDLSNRRRCAKGFEYQVMGEHGGGKRASLQTCEPVDPAKEPARHNGCEQECEQKNRRTACAKQGVVHGESRDRQPAICRQREGQQGNSHVLRRMRRRHAPPKWEIEHQHETTTSEHVAHFKPPSPS